MFSIFLCEVEADAGSTEQCEGIKHVAVAFFLPGRQAIGSEVSVADFVNFRNVALAMCTLGLMDPEGGTVFPRIDPNAALSRAWPPEYFLGADGLTAASRH